ncbi:MAG: FAD-dependent oxidoreductase [Thiolinea sp.]
MRKTEVIVVGAGIAGSMSALALVRQGHKVTLIDRWEPGHSRASSTDYNRIIRSIHGRDEFYTQWARDSRLRWLELQEETGQKLYYECGSIILATEGHCDWENATAETFTRLGVPFNRFAPHELPARFPQFDSSNIAYGLYEPESGMIMAHRAVITTVQLFRKLGGVVKRGSVTTDANEKLMLDGKPLEADLIVVATGPWMGEMYPRTVKPITTVIGVNVLYTSTPDGSDQFDQHRMPCWIDHGEGSFGLPSVEGSGVKAAVVIPDKIDLDNDERLIKKAMLGRTRQYIKKRLPGLVGEKVVDSKFNQIIITPDTHFILDWHPEHNNVLLAGGCSGHLFKHGPVFGEFAAGVGTRQFGAPERFKLGPRKKLSPKESPSGR